MLILNNSSLSARTFQEQSSQAGGIIIDVRTPAEYIQAHIPDAVNIDFYHPDFDRRIAALDRAKTYFVYCKSGMRSSKTLHRLKELGFEKIFNLDGGIIAWIDDKREVLSQ